MIGYNEGLPLSDMSKPFALESEIGLPATSLTGSCAAKHDTAAQLLSPDSGTSVVRRTQITQMVLRPIHAQTRPLLTLPKDTKRRRTPHEHSEHEENLHVEYFDTCDESRDKGQQAAEALAASIRKKREDKRGLFGTIGAAPNIDNGLANSAIAATNEPSLPERHIGEIFTQTTAIEQNSRWFSQVFTLASIKQKLAENSDGDADGLAATFESSSTSAQRSLWSKMAKDPQSGARKLLMGCIEQIERVERIAQTAPNFTQLTDMIIAALRASMHTQRPVRLPPVLLLGSAGIGKTHVSSQIARALETEFRVISMPSQSDAGPFSGIDSTWKNPKMGQVAEMLLQC